MLDRYTVYLMTNRWRTTLYIGVTNDMQRRYFEHRSGSNDGFTKRYNLNVLVHVETFVGINDAIRREKVLKSWKREKKIALIESANPDWKDLAELWFDVSRPC